MPRRSSSAEVVPVAHRRNSRGRPAVVDTQALAATAYRLFRARGYDETSMDEIADAGGVARSTLFRYFASKSDLLWAGQEGFTQRFRAALARAPGTGSVLGAVFEAYRHFLADEDPGYRDVVRMRLAVIVTAPSESTGMWSRYREWSEVIAGYVASRSACGPLEAEAAGCSIWSAIWAALSRWALDGDAELGECLDRAEAALRTLSGT